MNPVLERLARSRNQAQFRTTYRALFGGTQTDADNAYNAYIQQINLGRGGGGVNTGSGYNGGYNTNNTGSGGGITDIFGRLFDGVNGLVKTTVGFSQKIYNTQLGQSNSITDNSDVGNQLLNMLKKGGINPLNLLSTGIQGVEEGILDQLTRESQLKSEINGKTTLTLKLSEDLRDDILESSVNAAKFGFTINEVGELYSGLVEKSGRFALINKETFDKAAPVVRSFGTTMEALSETINEFEKVGIGANKTIDTIFEAGRKSMTLGLNGRKIVTDIQTNIAKLNSYGFKTGIEGLAEMVRKSTEFRMNMEETFKVAEKVMSPEGALELTANLQVLGGAIGDFNDPLKLMYMATNNVEGLQDALIGAAGSLATYNKEQGKFEITGINLRRARELATQLGVSYDELAKGSIAAAERSSAAAALMSSGLRMKDEDKEFLTNLSRMEGGEMIIKVPESLMDKFNGKTQIALGQLTQGMKDTLIENKKAFEKLNPEDIAMAQLTETQKMSSYLNQIVAYFKNRGGRTVRGVLTGSGLENVLLDQYKEVKKYADDINNRKPDPTYRARVEGKTSEIKTKVDNTIDDLKKIPERTNDWIKDKTGINLGLGSINVNHKHEHMFKSDNMGDEIGRAVIKNPHAYSWLTPKFEKNGYFDVDKIG
jgi:hypothetical protein